jgi:hypothetical protein
MDIMPAMRNWCAGVALLSVLSTAAECQYAMRFASWNGQAGSASADARSYDPVFFSQFRSVLQSKTPVPPRLPTYFPRIVAKKELYVKIDTADETGYKVYMGLVEDCDGQSACRFGTLIGTTLPFDQISDLEGRKSVPVRLQNGINGFYYESQCQASCNDSMVAWTEGKYQYVLGLKAEEQAYVVKAANSAIAPNTKPQ